MKAIKIIAVVILVVVAGIGGLVFYGLSNLDSLVKTAVERFGSEAVGTQVTLNSVDIDLQSGRADLGGFTIANPEGYSTDYAFALDNIVVQLDPASVAGREVIVIREIIVDGASVIAELRSLRESNLRELADNIQGNLPDKKPVTEPEPSSEYTGPNLRVERFRFTNADISLVSDQFENRTLEMPAVTANDLGGEDGLPPKELAAALMDQVIQQAIAAVRNEIEGAARREIRSELQERTEESLNEEQRERLQDLRDRLNR